MFAQNEFLRITIALATVVLVFALLQLRKRTPTELLFCLALGFFVLCGIITPDRAWVGFADSAVIAIGGLLIVSSALRTSGVLDQVGQALLGRVHTERGALSKLSFVVVSASAFLLNTAIVAMLLPLVVNWCRRHRISPSRLLLPISYLAILGGTCTLVGTSTNFVVNSKLESLTALLQASGDESGGPAVDQIPEYAPAWLSANVDQLRPMTLTDISWVGVPCAIVGAILIITCRRWLLPNRVEMIDSLEEKRREYLVEMLVTAGCPLIDHTVEEGGLRHLDGLFLIEIDRDGDVLAPVAPSDRIRENDRLVFTGIVATIVELEKIPGLIPAADINYEILPDKASQRSLVEVVLSPSSPMIGTSIRRANFRQQYGAAVVAVHRNGERLPTKIGDIVLTAGDTLLLQTRPGFVNVFRNRSDFYLVSGVVDKDPRRHDKLGWAALIAMGLIVWLLLTPVMPWLLSPLYGSDVPSVFTKATPAIFLAALAMIVTRCITVQDARNAIDLPMLMTIGAAIGVGNALHDCGAADFLAERMVLAVGGRPYLALLVVFAITVMLTEMISNVAVAAMMVSIALGLANNLDVSPRPFIMAITLAASLSFVSPIGYQTNLMVMGPGGYRPADYLRAGLPLSIAMGLLALLLIPLIWPF